MTCITDARSSHIACFWAPQKSHFYNRFFSQYCVVIKMRLLDLTACYCKKSLLQEKHVRGETPVSDNAVQINRNNNHLSRYVHTTLGGEWKWIIVSLFATQGKNLVSWNNFDFSIVDIGTNFKSDLYAVKYWNPQVWGELAPQFLLK